MFEKSGTDWPKLKHYKKSVEIKQQEISNTFCSTQNSLNIEHMYITTKIISTIKQWTNIEFCVPKAQIKQNFTANLLLTVEHVMSRKQGSVWCYTLTEVHTNFQGVNVLQHDYIASRWWWWRPSSWRRTDSTESFDYLSPSIHLY